MPTTRLYYDGKLAVGATVNLDHRSHHYVQHVLRLKSGDAIILFNGHGGEYRGNIEQLDKKAAAITIHRHDDSDRESPLSIELGQGISRGDKMDYVIQKAVELGVRQITPLFTERCGVKLSGERLQKRLDHWQGIIINAAEQSGRCRLPKLNPPPELNHWLTTQRHDLSLVCNPRAKKNLSQQQQNTTTVTLLIGPEGGLSTQELNSATQNGFIDFSLGPRTLRTETATVTALSLLQQRWGDL